MNTQRVVTQQAPVSRIDRTGWLVLAISLVIFLCAISLQVVYPLLIPGDGWSYDDTAFGQVPARIVLLEYLGDEPSPLQQGDTIIAVHGRPMADVLRDVYTFQPRRPPSWIAGSTVDYTVVRDGDQLTVAVPLRRLIEQDPSALIDVAITIFVGLIMVAVGLFVFVRRPSDPAAQVLLIFTCSLAGGIAYLPSIIAGLFSLPLIIVSN